MYHQIHKMSREGWKPSQISNYLVLDRRTVKKYLSMSEEAYYEYLDSLGNRKRELQAYENFVKSKLEAYPETSAAQMHDWLKEHNDDFPGVSSKTVYNFVMWIRQQHNIPKQSKVREYSIVEQLPYGQQAQVDFGQYNMRSGKDKRVKVYFFTMVLSRSRFKYVLFCLTPFTTALTIKAHQKAFEYIGGIPREIVYDQDSVLLVDENKGDLLLSSQFLSYCKSMPFNLYFCRKADPQSKGKVENVVKYVKQNFLYNRPFSDKHSLNQEALSWLSRTANGMPHSFTRKIPMDELIVEKQSLLACQSYVLESVPNRYTVRKDNTISYKGNFYTLPVGTYKGKGSQVDLCITDKEIRISDLEGNLLCTHQRSEEVGKIVSNTNHKRDKSKKINTLLLEVALMFPDYDQALIYLNKIRKAKRRYVRDQLTLIKKSIEKTTPQIVGQTLNYCLENNIISANDFAAVIKKYCRESGMDDEPPPPPKPLDSNINKKIAEVIPDKSNIADYEQIMKN